MTDRHAGYLVTLTQNIREDDAQQVIATLQMIKGVLSVEPIVANMETRLAENRARSDLRTRLFQVLNEYPD